MDLQQLRASHAAVIAADPRARLLPWIRSLPHGWDTRVGTDGTAVSGGERQRLALARAFLPYQRMWESRPTTRNR
jgi:ATP-binding cassette subfamily C protein CydC